MSVDANNLLAYTSTTMVSGPNSEDTELAETLRRDDPEQFVTLVRMHLSFVLDLNTDECDGATEKSGKFRNLKWSFTPFAKKAKPINRPTSEGVSLTHEIISQVNQLIQWLRLEQNIIQEGIFRRSGKMTRQQELKNLLESGCPLKLEEGQFSVHDCASVLKNFLAHLSEPLLTEAHFPAHCQIAELCSGEGHAVEEERLLKSIQLILLLLPLENLHLLKDLIGLLHLTSTYAHINKMSADNLATLFTPHLLCPRKLSPEALHTNSQIMSGEVSFMIKQGPVLFHIPAQLATDIRAYWSTREKRALMPKRDLNESTCDGMAAKTVFTFVDRELTAEASAFSNPTEAALAQLYAHIQSLPESSKKRKLIKQFNKENGQGTPQLVMGSHGNARSSRSRHRNLILNKPRQRSRSFGESIKKHIPVFAKGSKDLKKSCDKYSVKDTFESPLSSPVSKAKIYFEKSAVEGESPFSPSVIPSLKKSLVVDFDDETKSLRMKLSANTKRAPILAGPETCVINQEESDSQSSNDSNSAGDEGLRNVLKRTSPSSHFDGNCYSKDCGPTKSPRLEPTCPTSVLPVSSTESLAESPDVNHPPGTCSDDSWPEDMMTPRSRKPVVALSSSNLSQLAHLGGWGRSGSGELRRDATSRATLLSEAGASLSCKFLMKEESFIEQEVDENLDSETSLLIPIEKMLSKGIPRETANREEVDKLRDRAEGCKCYDDEKCNSCSGVHGSLDYFSCSSDGSGALTETFREAVLSRSVLTASPVDLSFSSHTGDFDTSSDREVRYVLNNDNNLSESLLFCLDGNEPSHLNRSNILCCDQDNNVHPSQEEASVVGDDVPVDPDYESSVGDDDEEMNVNVSNNIGFSTGSNLDTQEKDLITSKFNKAQLEQSYCSADTANEQLSDSELKFHQTCVHSEIERCLTESNAAVGCVKETSF